jgi:C1A family cysteine protease
MAPDPIPQQTARGFGTGWIPDDYDHNDNLLGDLYGMQRLPMKEVYQNIFEKAEKRTKFTLEDSCPPVYDQLDLGSCVANATAAALRFAWKNSFAHFSTPYEEFDPSRLWIYYYARMIGNDRKDLEFRDTGCQIRDALKVLKNKGVCTEEAWPYLKPAESQAGKLQTPKLWSSRRSIMSEAVLYLLFTFSR